VFAEYRLSPVATSWKLPFNLALLCHILILASAIILPKYINKRPVLPEFLSVDLINIAAPLLPPVTETKPSQAQTPTKQKVAIQKLKPVQSRKVAPIAPIVSEQPPAVPTKAISIKPLKRKVKKKLPTDNRAQKAKKLRDAEQRKQQQAQERQRQQFIQEAQRQKVLADAEEAAAADAVKALRQMLLADAATTTAQATQTPQPRRGGSSSSVIETQYNSSIGGKLMAHWALPEIKTWNPNLSAHVIIHIAKNGRIISHSFEKRSGDRVFDQFVSRTIQEVNPLPPIPAAMRVSQHSIGLRFKPGQIQ
jgi:colicin import membrane protein